MTDDEQLAALFRDAAGTPPPPAFGHRDVTAASRRIGARRRAALVTGAAVLAAVVGIGTVVALPRGADTATTVASGAAASSPAEAAAPQADTAGRAPAAASVAPAGPGPGACASRQDPALRALVDQALPQVAGAPPAATSDVCLPGTERYVGIQVADGGAPGILTVASLPAGTAVSLPAGNYRSAPTASGGTVIVGSSAVGSGPAPYGDRLAGLLAYLAPRL